MFNKEFSSRGLCILFFVVLFAYNELLVFFLLRLLFTLRKNDKGFYFKPSIQMYYFVPRYCGQESFMDL